MSKFDKTEITVKDENDEVISHKPAPSKPKGRPAKKEIKIEEEKPKVEDKTISIAAVSEGAASEMVALPIDERINLMDYGIEWHKKELRMITTSEFNNAQLMMFYQGAAMGITIFLAAELFKKNVIDKFM